MRRMIKSFFRRTKESIFDFTADPINNLGFLVPVMIGLASLISGVLNYIMFINNGGYVTQVDILKEYGLSDGVGEAFTTGTTGLIVTGVVGKILIGLVVVEFIIMMIGYFNNSYRARIIIMIVDLVILLIQTVLTMKVFGKAIIKLGKSEKAAYEYLESLGGITAINPKATLVTYGVITAISLITFFSLILIQKSCRQMIGYTCKSLFFAIVIVPITFWLLQNIIPIVGVIVIVLFIIIFAKIFNYMMSDHPEDIEWKKDELERAKKRSKDYKASADGHFKSAKEGLNIFTTAEEKREQGRKDLKKASEEEKYARKLQEDIENLEKQFGKQN